MQSRTPPCYSGLKRSALKNNTEYRRRTVTFVPNRPCDTRDLVYQFIWARETKGTLLHGGKNKQSAGARSLVF